MDKKSLKHATLTNHFTLSLKKNTRIFTSNVAIGEAYSSIKEKLGSDLANQFNEIIENANLGNHLRILWIGRRTQREAMRVMRKYGESNLSLFDFAHSVFMEKRNIQKILTTKTGFLELSFEVPTELE
jgi:predicted nucleic acid-binding protein